jgi:5-methylthioribose kinase
MSCWRTFPAWYSSGMLELNEANLLRYLRQRNWIGPEPAQATLLSGGVSNAVFRVDSAEHALVVKQSRPQLRTRDPWFSDLQRVYREQEVMQLLHRTLPESVPEILFVDRDNFVFAMSAAPAAAVVWKTQLLAADVDLALGERCGALLGKIHQATADCPAALEPFRDRKVFVQLRVDPFYRRVQERRPEVAEPIERLVQQLLTVSEALCHGDYTPKNLLVHGPSLTLVDYETAHYGDPTMDLGLLLCHLVLKAALHSAHRERFFDLTRAFWRGYAAQVRFVPLATLQTRGIAHVGACLLARVDGTSPVDYLTEPVRAAVRRLGTSVLLNRPERWDAVLAMCTEELTGL